MSKKINPVLIGTFVLSALLIFALTVLTLLNGKIFRNTSEFVLYFNNSINGLDVGSAVKFKGVRIGNVKTIDVSYDPDKEVVITPILIEIDNNIFQYQPNKSISMSERQEFYKQQILSGLAAKLSMESLVTGKLFIELDYYPSNKLRFFTKNNSKLPQIPTVPSEIDTFISGADTLLKNFSEFEFGSISKSLSSVLKRLDQQLEKIDLTEIAHNISQAVVGFRNFITSEKTQAVVQNANSALSHFQNFLNETSSSIQSIKTDFATATTDFRKASQTFGKTCEDISSAAGPDSEFRKIVRDFLTQTTKTIQELRFLLEILENNPNALVAGLDHEEK